MLISVIIPALNEERYIENCLKSIMQQKFLNVEVIVVANGCNDKTAEIAKKYINKVIETEKKGVSYARNLGAKISNGEILVFVDADCILEPGVLLEIFEAVKNGYVAGSCNTKPDNSIFFDNLFWGFYNFISYYLKKTNGLTFFRRDIFLELKSYNENLNVGEDIEIYHNAKKYGDIKHITKSGIKTSMRKFRHDGYIKTLLIWEFSHFFPFSKEYKEIR